MTELEVLQQLADETGLLAMRLTIDGMRASAHAFTVAAVSRLGRDKWSQVLAPPGGNAIDGVRIDKIIHRGTLQIVDIIINADDPDGPARRATWDVKGMGRPEDVADPPPPGPAPAPLPTPAPAPPADEFLVMLGNLADDVERMANGLENIGEALVTIGAELKAAFERGVPFRFRR